MKSIFRRSLSLLLALCFVLCCTAMGVTAQEEESAPTYVVEVEDLANNPYTGTLQSGAAWKHTKSSTGTYYTTEAGVTGASCTGIIFQDATGDTIEWKVNVETAGKYSFQFAYRSHNSYFCWVSLTVNGNAPSYIKNVNLKANAVNGKTTNSPNDSKNNFQNLDLGNVWLDEGENTITLTQTGNAGSKTTLFIDKFTFVYADQLQFEAEDTPFVATDSTGAEKGTWAYNLAAKQVDLIGDISYHIAYFHSGGLGGTIEYTLDVAEAGEYGIVINTRTHDFGYCVFRVLVNGEQVGGYVSNKTGDSFNGELHQAMTMKEMNIGNATFKKGENTVTIQIVETNRLADEGVEGQSTAIILDYIRLTEAFETEPEYTVANRKLAVKEEKEYNVYYQTRTNSKDSQKIDIRVVMAVPAADIEGKDSIKATVKFSDGTELKDHEITTVYSVIEAVDSNWTYMYNSPDGYVIFGVVVTGAPAGTAATAASWVIE